MTRLRNAAVIRPNSVLVTSRPATDESGERTNAQLGQYALSKPPGQPHRWTGEQSLRPFGAFPLVDGSFCGAGGNRTPVHQVMNDPDTTIPALSLTQRRRRVGSTITYSVVVRESSFRIVSSLSCRQRSFSPSSSASVAGLRWIGPVRHFCSRCLFTHLRIRRRE
jgi:hypothetical protein